MIGSDAVTGMEPWQYVKKELAWCQELYREHPTWTVVDVTDMYLTPPSPSPPIFPSFPTNTETDFQRNRAQVCGGGGGSLHQA